MNSNELNKNRNRNDILLFGSSNKIVWNKYCIDETIFSFLDDLIGQKRKTTIKVMES